MPQFRIVRDGCVRAAVPLPAGVQARDVHFIRALAYDRPAAKGRPPFAPTPVHLTRINKVFMLDQDFLPRPSLFAWRGDSTIAPGGPPLELPVP